MRYVPDIIPPEHKIRPDYFTGGPPITTTENIIGKTLYVLNFIIGGIFMLGGLGLFFSGSKLSGILLWLAGFVAFPMGFNNIQGKLGASIPGWLRFVFVILLLVFASIFMPK
ncbi:MAG TPA: hypothetical protein VK174_10195 [Chitinophagales bacterium]|nr:hypothetical protein [Chitinophagales bacterium]